MRTALANLNPAVALTPPSTYSQEHFELGRFRVSFDCPVAATTSEKHRVVVLCTHEEMDLKPDDDEPGLLWLERLHKIIGRGACDNGDCPFTGRVIAGQVSTDGERCAVFYLDRDTLLGLIDIFVGREPLGSVMRLSLPKVPDGAHVCSVWDDPARFAFGCRVVDDSLPYCRNGDRAVELPNVTAMYERETINRMLEILRASKI